MTPKQNPTTWKLVQKKGETHEKSPVKKQSLVSKTSIKNFYTTLV